MINPIIRLLIQFTLMFNITIVFTKLGYRPTITYEDTGRYNNNAQQGGYDNNAQGFGGY